MERRLAAVLLTDMVGYSRLMGQDEAGTITRQKAHRELVFDPKIALHRGRVVKSTGDGLLVEFPSVVNAVECAVQVQRDLNSLDDDAPEDRRIQYRIGINLGDVVVEEDDILGDGVNVAARLEALAQPGGICISQAAFDQVKNRLDVGFVDIGPQVLKNIQEPVHVYALSLTGESPKKGDRSTNELRENERTTVAVLPFINMSGDPEQDYFADGITEDIITALSNVRTFNVLSRNSTFSYKGKSVDARQVGRDLNVQYVIEGSVRRAGDRIRVTAQLVGTRSGDQLWADRYDGTLQDIFDLQDKITSTVVGTIEPELLRVEGQRLQAWPPENMNAYDFLLRGVAFMHKVTPEDTKKALDCFREAIRLDPNYGRAYAFASWCYRREVEIRGLASLSEADQSRAMELARKALQCDRRDPFVLAYAGATLKQIGGDIDECLALTDQALSMHPNSHRFWNAKAIAHALRGDTTKAIEAAEHAISLAPNDPAIWNAYLPISYAHLQELRYELAEDFARRALRYNSDLCPAYYILAASMAERGNLEAAKDALAIALKFNPEMTVSNFKENYRVGRFKNLDNFLSGLRKAGLQRV